MPPATRVLAFLLIFTALFLFALVLVIGSEFSDAKWIKTIVRIGEGLGRLTFVSIAIAFILVEGVPMLAAWVRRELIKEAREKGRAEGQALEREAWKDWRRKLEEWEQRKADAENNGRAFDEPRPDPPADD